MSKLKVNVREIGSVCIFDLVGEPTPEAVEEAASKIQRSIRRHRLQRVIINFQMVPWVEPLGLRKLLAACIRPQRSLIYGASANLTHDFENTYIPRNMRICTSEKEVAEDFGPFLLDRERQGIGEVDEEVNPRETPGYQLERRRSKRMHVALPVLLKIETPEKLIETRAIATNISEGGLFAEYLDLEASGVIEAIDPIEGLSVAITVFPSANFPEEYQLRGKVNRREFRKKQLGIAVEFQV